MFENQIQKKSAAEEGEPAARDLAVEAAARDRVLGQVVGDLDRGLHAVRLLRHAARDPDHRDDRQAAGEGEVEDRLVDAEVEAADVERDPRFELELVLRLELFVLAGVAEDQQHQDRDRQVGAEPDQDFGFGLHARLLASGSSRWAIPCAAKEIVKRTRTRTAAASPASRSTARPTTQDRGCHQPDAAEGRRGDRPHRLLAVAVGQRFGGAAAGEGLDPALRQPGARRRPRSPTMGRSATTKTTSAAASAKRSTYLGGDIKSAQLRPSGRIGDYIRRAGYWLSEADS